MPLPGPKKTLAPALEMVASVRNSWKRVGVVPAGASGSARLGPAGRANVEGRTFEDEADEGLGGADGREEDAGERAADSREVADAVELEVPLCSLEEGSVRQQQVVPRASVRGRRTLLLIKPSLSTMRSSARLVATAYSGDDGE